MPGLASLLNGNPPDGNFIIHVFYTTNLLGVGFQRMSGKRSGKDPTDRFEASEDGQQGIVADDGQLAAIEYNGVHLVLGSTVNKGSTSYNDISIVSPVYKDIEKTEVKHKGLAVCKTNEDLNIFYISGTDEKALKVFHHTYESDNSVTLANMNQLLPGSSLAAYYNEGSDIRYVIYQAAEDQHLYEYDVEDRTFKEIKNSDGARPGTRIAVTYNDTQKKAYLYYTTQSNQLRRIIKTNGNWGSSSEVGVSKVDPASQVTVTFSDDTNHIFYVEHGKSASHTNDADSFAGDYIKHVRDRTDK